jgi:hypothetical protein
MHTRSRNLLTVFMVALLATLGTSAAQAKVVRNGTQTNGIWDKITRNGVQTNGFKIMRNGVETNGRQVEGGSAKAPVPGTPVTPQATTVTLPDGTTLPLR